MEIKKLTSVKEAGLLADLYISDSDNFDKIYKNVLEELKEIGENRIIFVGLEDGLSVGTVQLILNRADNDPELANGSTIGHVHHLKVKDSELGIGRGRELMEYLERYSKERGIKKLTLGVDDVNTNAIGFYTHLGYKKFKEAEGRNPKEKVIYMVKEIKKTNGTNN